VAARVLLVPSIVENMTERTFIGSLLQLLVLSSLLNEIQDLEVVGKQHFSSPESFQGSKLEKHTWSLRSASARGHAFEREAGSAIILNHDLTVEDPWSTWSVDGFCEQSGRAAESHDA
jgi:hypothetical protein